MKILWRSKEKTHTEEMNKQIQMELGELRNGMDDIHNAVMMNQKALKKYGLTMEEVIDTIERGLSQKSSEEQKLQDMSERIEHLLEVIFYYQEQSYRMNRILEENENWSSSVTLLESDESSQLYKNGMVLIKDLDTTFTFELHEVIDTMDTNVKEQNERIAKIHVPGLIYQGQVIRKAKVTVYRYTKKIDED